VIEELRRLPRVFTRHKVCCFQYLYRAKA